MSGYTKLFSEIVDSSIWEEDPDIFKVWIALLAMADSEGFVRGSPNWLARKCKISQERCLMALQKFQAPDPLSRSTFADGRRIKAVDHGWLILNYVFFRNSRNEFNPTTGQKEKGKVYYAADADSKEIKIGFSINPWARLKELKVARPRIAIVATEPGNWETERARHEQFSAYRKEGEWFDFSHEIQAFIDVLRCVAPAATVATTVATPASASASASASVQEIGVQRKEGNSSTEATIPSFDEIKEIASTRGIPFPVAKSFFDYYQANNLWLNRHDRPINIGASLTRWASNERQKHYANHKGYNPKNLQKPPPTPGSTPVNGF